MYMQSLFELGEGRAEQESGRVGGAESGELAEVRYTTPKMPAPRSKQQSFEDLYQQLEEKVALLEAGGLSLDDSLQAYEDAVSFAQRCQQLLDRAELRITRLRETIDRTGPADGDEAFEPDEEDFDDDEDDEAP